MYDDNKQKSEGWENVDIPDDEDAQQPQKSQEPELPPIEEEGAEPVEKPIEDTVENIYEEINIPREALDDIEKQKRYISRREDARKRRLRKIRRIRVRFVVKILMLAFLIFSLVRMVNTKFWYLPTNVLKLHSSKAMNIKGMNLLNSEMILNEISDIELAQKPLYMLDVKPIEVELKKNPFIKDAYVMRRFPPAKLSIFIKERTPVLSIVKEPKGEVVAVVTSDYNDLKVIEAPYLFDKALEGNFLIVTTQNYKAWTPTNMDYLIYLSKTVERYSGQKLAYIDMRDPDDIFVYMEGYTLRIGEINKSVFGRVKRIKTLVPQLVKMRDKVEYIDLRWEKSTFIKIKKGKR